MSTPGIGVQRAGPHLHGGVGLAADRAHCEAHAAADAAVQRARKGVDGRPAQCILTRQLRPQGGASDCCQGATAHMKRYTGILPRDNLHMASQGSMQCLEMESKGWWTQKRLCYYCTRLKQHLARQAFEDAS